LPFRIGYLPAGLQFQMVSAHLTKPAGETQIMFSPTGTTHYDRTGTLSDRTLPPGVVSIILLPNSQPGQFTVRNTKVDGHAADFEDAGDGQRVLAVDVGVGSLTLQGPYSKAELIKIFRSITLAPDVDDPATWFDATSRPAGPLRSGGARAVATRPKDLSELELGFARQRAVRWLSPACWWAPACGCCSRTSSAATRTSASCRPYCRHGPPRRTTVELVADVGDGSRRRPYSVDRAGQYGLQLALVRVAAEDVREQHPQAGAHQHAGRQPSHGALAGEAEFEFGQILRPVWRRLGHRRIVAARPVYLVASNQVAGSSTSGPA